METEKKKIVVTSLGVCSPLGNSIHSFQQNYTENWSIEKTKIEDDILEKELGTHSGINQRRMDRLTRVAMMAAVSCFKEAELELDESTVDQVGGIFCTAYGPIASSRDFINSGFKLGLESASPIIFPYTVANSGPGLIAILMKARGFSTTVSGYNPIAYAYDTIQNNKAKALLAGGFEELTPETERAYATRTVEKIAENSKIAAPIEQVSEGAAMLFVEEEKFALSRNANVLFEICGYGVRSNPQNKERSIDNFGYIFSSAIQGTMENAFLRSDVAPSQISLIISLAREDSEQIQSEKEAIQNIWAEKQPEIHYTKKITGETLGASSSFATITGYLKGLEPNGKGDQEKYVLINSYHIGGNCFSLIIKV